MTVSCWKRSIPKVGNPTFSRIESGCAVILFTNHAEAPSPMKTSKSSDKAKSAKRAIKVKDIKPRKNPTGGVNTLPEL